MRHSSFILMLIASSMLVVGLGSAVSVMDVDAAQYASISREMSVTGSVLKIYNGGREYLDKPPLLFWLSSALF
jgi:4-amino-4-deoxy-L-arabinose transferase-like glycosyltransferase